jgi:elongation factor G
MPKYATEDIRNIALVGHGSTGKSTLAEGILFDAKTITRRGSIDDGSSVSDFDPQEKERNCSINLSVMHAPWGGKEFNILDAPGYPDYIGGAFEALAAADTAVILVSAPAGIEVNTRLMWEKAGELGLARILVINKMDADNVDFPKLLEEIKNNFGNACTPMVLPVGQSGSFAGVVSTLNVPSDVPAGVLGGDPESMNAELMESVLEADDALLEKYLGGEEVGEDEIKGILPKALVAGTIVPMFCTNARDDIGLPELMNFVANFAPSPTQATRPTARQGEEEVTLDADPSKPLMGRVFKVNITDVGRRSFLRVFQGTLAPDGSFYKVGDSKANKPGHIYKMQGKEQEQIDAAIAGDIVSVVKVENLEIGDTFADKAEAPVLPAIDTPRPMCSLAVTPKSQKDEQKITEALTKLVDIDPTFATKNDAQTHELVVSGMSNLHLDVMLNRLKENFKVEVDTKTPRIPYLETITANAEGHYRHKKQTGGAGQFGEVYIRIMPRGDRDNEDPLTFENKIVGGAISGPLIPPVEKGIREAMTEGILAGYHVIDITVELYDGKMHPVDSKEIAFRLAGRNAFREAFMEAKPVLLEPIADAEITVPGDLMGDIIGDLNTRRGQIQGMEASGAMQVIKARVPLAEMQNYATDLRSITGGQGMFTMEPAGYEQVPSNVQQQVVEQAKKEQEEEKE